MKHILILPDGKETEKMKLDEIKGYLDENNYPSWVSRLMTTHPENLGSKKKICVWVPVQYTQHPCLIFLPELL